VFVVFLGGGGGGVGGGLVRGEVGGGWGGGGGGGRGGGGGGGGRDFLPVQTGPGTHPASCTMGTGWVPGLSSG